MNTRPGKDTNTLLHEMDKYNFNKTYQVSVSILENDNETELSKLYIDNGKIRENSTLTNLRSDTVTSIYFEKEHINPIINYNIVEDHGSNSVIDVNMNEEAQNDSRVNRDSCGIETPLPLQRTSISPTLLREESCSSFKQTHPQMDYSKELHNLSNAIIQILKAYRHYCTCLQKVSNDEVMKKYTEMYLRIKRRNIMYSCGIVTNIILPQGEKFKLIDFLYKTSYNANLQYKVHCTYDNVKNIYNEILKSCYSDISGSKSCCTPTNIMKIGHSSTRQENSQNDRNYNNIAQNINKSHTLKSQQYFQNNHVYNNTKTLSNAPQLMLQELLQNGEYCNNVTQTINKRPDFTPELNLSERRNLKQNRPREHNSNITPNYKKYRQSTEIIQKQNKAPNSISRHNLQTYQQNSSEQNVSFPKTCVFQSGSPNNEIRVDIDTQVLNNIQELYKGNALNINDHSHASAGIQKQAQSTEFLNAAQHTPYQGASPCLLEPVRSTSRDSGFMSPCNNQIGDSNNTGVESDIMMFPYIAHVTSLNPEAKQYQASETWK